MTVVTPDLAGVVDPALHASGEVHELWRWMRRHAPVHWHEPGDLPGFWSLTRHDDIRDVYRNPAVFSSARGVLLRPTELGEDPGSGLTMALADPPRHRALRGQLADRFSERCARSLAGEMRAEIRSVVTRAVEGWCEKNGVARVTPEILDAIRSRMPTPKVFGASAPRGDGADR